MPEANVVWKFLINIIQMLDILQSGEFTSLDLMKLKQHIEYHNKEYVALFSDGLKPKHHFLVHYCRTIRSIKVFMHF